MKNNKKTFAQRAKELTIKYKRAGWDKTEADELNAALEKLSQEQEVYKQANGIGDYNPENQEQQQYDGVTGTSYLRQPTYGFNVNSPILPTIFGQPVVQEAKSSLNVSYPEATTISAPETVIGSTQGILPSALSGAASVLGNVGMALFDKPIYYNKTYAPEQISLANERERMTREGNLARNIMNRNLRASNNRGAYLSNVGVSNTALNRQLSDQLSQSYTKESLANLEQRQRANELNRQIDLMNYQNKVQNDQERKAYISNAINAATAAGTDINQILGQNKLIEALGTTNYGYVPTNNSWRDLLYGRVMKGKVRQ